MIGYHCLICDTFVASTLDDMKKNKHICSWCNKLSYEDKEILKRNFEDVRLKTIDYITNRIMNDTKETRTGEHLVNLKFLEDLRRGGYE